MDLINDALRWDIVAPARDKSSTLNRIIAIYKWICWMKKHGIENAVLHCAHVMDGYGEWATLLGFSPFDKSNPWKRDKERMYFYIPVDELIKLLPTGIMKALEEEENVNLDNVNLIDLKTT